MINGRACIQPRTFRTKAQPPSQILLCIRHQPAKKRFPPTKACACRCVNKSSSQTVYIPTSLRSVWSISRKSNVCNRRITFARRHSLPLYSMDVSGSCSSPILPPRSSSRLISPCECYGGSSLSYLSAVVG